MQVVFQDPYGSFNPRHKVERLVAEPLHLLDKKPTRPSGASMVAAALHEVGLQPDATSTNIRTNSPAASASACRSRAPSSPGRS